MIGGCSKVVQDIAPYMMADGNPAETRFVNKVGLERAGFAAESVSNLTKAYKVLFRSGLTTANALARLGAHDFPVALNDATRLNFTEVAKLETPETAAALRVVVADMAAYDGFYKRLIGAFPLKNVTSRFAMERVKSTTAYHVSLAP